MKFQIVTNNPQVRDAYEGTYAVTFVQGTLRDVLVEAHSMAEQGHLLLTHPLSGSIKPNETPYKSILVSLKPKAQVDAESITLMDKALATVDKFADLHNHWNQRALQDFQTVDHTLIASAVESAVLDFTQ